MKTLARVAAVLAFVPCFVVGAWVIAKSNFDGDALWIGLGLYLIGKAFFVGRCYSLDRSSSVGIPNRGERAMNCGRLSRAAALVVVIGAACVSGCQSTHGIQKAAILGKTDLRIEQVQVWRAWLKDEPGRGLRIEVWARADSPTPSADLEPELDGAARVFAELARTGIPQKWDYVSLLYSRRYGTDRPANGACRIIMRADAIRSLGGAGAPPDEFRKHWRFVSGYKDAAGSKTPLSWGPDPRTGQPMRAE